MGLQIDFSKILDCYSRIGNCLDDNIRTIGNRIGWHQIIGENNIGETATAQGILILSYLKKSHSRIEDIILTLKNSQDQSNNLANKGGWSFLTNRNYPTIEATAWILLALKEIGEPLNSTTMQSGLEWIVNQKNDDGGWGPRRGMVSRTYCTFLAIKAIKAFSSKLRNMTINLRTPFDFTDTETYLSTSKNVSDDGWGAYKGDPSTSIHTAFAILSMKILGKSSNEDIIQKGIRFIYHEWKFSTNWEDSSREEWYQINNSVSGWNRITFKHFPTAWVVISLLTNGESVRKKQILNSIRWILNSQNSNGTWKLKNVSGHRLWAIHDSLLTIITLLQNSILLEREGKMVIIDNWLVLPKSVHKYSINAILIFAISLYFVVLIGGILIGAIIQINLDIQPYIRTIFFLLDGLLIILALYTIFKTLGHLVKKNWAWVILILYILITPILLVTSVLTLQEILYGLFVEVLMVVIQEIIKK